MLTTTEWQKIKTELKKNIEPLFLSENLNINGSFERVLDIFQLIIEKEIGNKDIDDREQIGNVLKIRYILKDGNHYPNVLSTLAIKFETYLKRIYKLANETIWTGENDKMKGLIVTFVKKHKYTYNDPDFLAANDGEVFDAPHKKFFKTDSNTKPIYTPRDIAGKFPFSERFKWTYDIANSQRHTDPTISEDELPKLITNVIACYIYVASKYSEKLKKELIHNQDISAISEWNIFKQHCGNFSKNQAYFLIVDNLSLPTDQLGHFANIKWDFVFDFDTASDVKGLYHTLSSLNKFPQVINQIVHTSDDRGKITAIFPDNTTFWFYAQGIQTRQKSLVATNRFADWRGMYGRYVQDLMREYYAKKYSFNLKTIKIVVLSKNVEKVRELLYAIKDMDTNLPPVEIIFANDDNSKFLDLISEIPDGKNCSLSLSNLVEGLREMEDVMHSVRSSDSILLPCHSSKGKNIKLPIETVNSVKQYFHIIHLNILSEQEDVNSDKTFYQGRVINWKELDNHQDVDRAITKDIIKKIRTSFENREEATLIYLTHYAGSGGSTIAKRLAYEIYQDFPVLFLNETISSYNETQLSEKLLQIYKHTEIPSLVIIDNSNVTRQQIEILEKVAANKLAKTIFLLTESTFVTPLSNTNRFYVPAALDNNEANRFVEKFSREYSGKAADFQNILKEDSNLWNPFYFGLIANEEEYVTIDQYVAKRLEGLKENEKDLLKLLAFCQFYANGKLREVPHFVISNFLDINEDYIRLKKHTQNQKIYDLIVETDDLSWRTSHHLIANSILRQLLGTNDSGKVLDPFSLKDFAIKLIGSLRNISENRNEQVLELLHNIFILRDIESINNDSEEAEIDFSNKLYDKKLFSKFINDLDNNNRLEVFEVLTIEFPDENPHFWGHFSRLHSINLDLPKALETIEKAVEIDEEEYIFYHIKGMCYRMELYRLLDRCKNNKGEYSTYSLQIASYFENASEAFQTTRELAPKKEHGYISFIQMAIQMIECEYSISNLKTPEKDYTKFITANNKCRNILTQANEVISDYRDYNQEFENPKIKEKENQLLRFFGSQDDIINAWKSLLDKQGSDKNLARRQIAYAYMAKNEFDWEKAKGKDLKKILELYEENLRNKVETRDLRLWFEAARRLGVNTTELIPKAQEWEFKKESLETSYILMCLFGVEATNDIKSNLSNYEKYQRIIRERSSNIIFSKVFCFEWIGENSGNSILLNHRQIGEWSREKSFFSEQPINLRRLKGTVVRYISRTQGYLEIENCGIQVMYQPASCNHYSDDEQKGTKVSFYVGFNYDGARAFEVKNE
ncbi:hypothetical protein [Leadbetterella sp. DM7]|uniref:P-loop NTPase n=1 Tax=Leadbetterella sp. DM7 TaxID=3235085 RepID=UPI00349EE6D8